MIVLKRTYAYCTAPHGAPLVAPWLGETPPRAALERGGKPNNEIPLLRVPSITDPAWRLLSTALNRATYQALFLAFVADCACNCNPILNGLNPLVRSCSFHVSTLHSCRPFWTGAVRPR